jgi:hypothetical protein
MLAHSPPLPLVIEFFHTGWDISAEEEERIILALKQRDRVYRVRIWMPVPNLQKVILAMDEEYPALDCLIMGPSTQDYSTALIFPETLQAPHLRHLLLMGFALPMGSRLLTAAVGLVILILVAPHPSAYFQPNILLQWLSFMSQLETLVIDFSFPVLDRDVERQLMHSPIPAHITLPNLLIFVFQGDNAYMEALVHRISTPCLKSLSIELFNQPTFSVPPFLPFINTIENRRFTFAKFWFFGEKVCVAFYPYGEAEMTTLHIDIGCWHLDWQVSSMAQILNPLSQLCSTVQCVSIEHETHSWSSEEHNEVDRAEWRKLLRPFNNVRLLYVYDGLVKDLSRSLRLEAGDFPLDLLPELEELKYPGSSDTGDAFTSFVDARKNSGRPVTLVSDQVL